MRRVLFVCTGNICRSPAAHAVFAAHVARAGVPVEVDSAGLGGWHAGELPDERARAEGLSRGYRLDHRARRVRPEEIATFDLVVAMDQGHARALHAMPGAAGRVVLYRSFEPGAAALDVADPYYDGPEAFAEMFDVVEAGVAGLLEWARR